MPVPFEEFEGSPTITFNDGRFEARRVFLVDWLDWPEFLVELYGGYRTVAGEFVYSAPTSFPGVPFAIPVEISVEPFPPDCPAPSGSGLAGQINTYAKAKVDVAYRMAFDRQRDDLPAVPDGTYLSFSSDLGSESRSVPPGGTVQGESNTPTPDSASLTVIIPTEQFTLSWQRVPRPPWNAIRDLRGKINHATFLNHAPGTVLFCGARTQRDFQIRDTGLWRLDYSFKVEEKESTVTPGLLKGWNYQWSPAAAGNENWLEIKNAAGTPLYAEGDLTQLFQFG